MPDIVLELFRRVADLERRLNNVHVPAKVTDIDAKKGLVKVTYAKTNDGKDVKSPWIPWKERAGSIKTWTPPSVGEQVFMSNPSGEIGQHSWVEHGGFSNDNKQPHNKGDEHVMDVNGKFKRHIDKSGKIVEDHKGDRVINSKGSKNEEYSGGITVKTGGIIRIN